LVIDAEGLFGGNRWRKCSAMARLNAPYLMLCSNGYGRLEIDPLRILARAYATFNPRPTEQDILGWVQEYSNASLMFLYEYDSTPWGIWDTPERLLLRYKTAADKRSPAPPEPAFSEWKSAYRSKSQSFPKFCENIPKVFGVDAYGEGDGVGVGAGEGEGKNICSPQAASVGGRSDLSSKRPATKATLEQLEWFAIFYSRYWRKKSKGAALRAFVRHVRNQERFDQVMKAVADQTPEMLRRDESKRPYPASWLNAEGWLDEVCAGAVDPVAEALKRVKDKKL
jgi:hypothetical protein